MGFLVSISILLAAVMFPVFGQTQSAKFKRINSDHGLSQNQVFCIYQDKLGMLWFGTQDGLNLYDGYKFKVFRHQPGNKNSLPDYAVNTICETDTGIFWIGTREGMTRFDLRKETFLHFTHNPDSANSLVDNTVWHINKDSKGNIWIATRNGLSRYNPEKKSFTNFTYNNSGQNSLSNNFVFTLVEDKYQNIWIGGKGGLDRYDPVQDKIFNYKIFQEDPENVVLNGVLALYPKDDTLWVGSYSGLYSTLLNEVSEGKIFFKKHLSNDTHLSIRSVYADNAGAVWAGSIEEGLIRYFPASNKKIIYKNSNDPESISEHYIPSLLIDNNGVLWIGTYSTGLNKYNTSAEKFITLNFGTTSESYSAEVTAVLEDRSGDFWVGTGSGNIIKLSEQTSGNFNSRQYISSNERRTFFGGVEIRAFIQDQKGKIWAGTFGNGIYIIDPLTNEIKQMKREGKFPKSLSNNFVHAIYESSDGTIWIGTGAGGLNEFNPAKNNFTIYRHNAKDEYSISTNEISTICEDKKGFIWVGTTTGGLNKLNRSTGKFERFTHKVTDLNSISSNRIICLYVDSKSTLWIGTFGGGLNKWNSGNNSFEHYTSEHGLPSNIINSIVEDQSGNLWVSTDKGISMFNHSSNTFSNYDVNDGLQGNEFTQNAGYTGNQTGNIYFGGVNGLNIINPRNLHGSDKLADIVLTDFRIFNKSVFPGDNSELKENILYAKEVILSHDENFFTFEFASLDFNNPDKNQYAYKLEGFNDDWIYNGTQRSATYTNLSPGEYIFRIKATNSSGVWNENGISFRVIILPPWWQTWWAYILYGLFFVSILYSLRQYEMKRVRLRNELQLKDFEAKKLKEVDQLKSHFFANISHEFRTPLTLILGLLQKIETKSSDAKDIEDVGVMRRNANRLLQLINQLLELSRIEAGKTKLSAGEYDIVSFAKRILVSFASYAEQKNLKLLFNGKEINEETGLTITMFFDKDKMEKIISNLISNAVKYTPGGNEIEVRVMTQNNLVEIKVINTGVTIPRSDLLHLFERYYKVHKAETGLFEGTGIGLALVKELVEMHKGSISAASEYDVTEFKIKMPLGKDHLKTDEIIIKAEQNERISEFASFENVESQNETPIEKDSIIKGENEIILIVEDHSDLRKYIRENLADTYEVIEAQNGKEGFDKACELIPDLIISDVMMPEMDGYTFCKKIKTTEKTNHIPVILLTAKASTGDKLEGLEIGADDYLIKPFNPDELKLRVRNLIKIREQLRQKFTSEMVLKPAEVIVPSSQVQFMEKLKMIIESNLEDEKFGVDRLSDEMGMSRSQLHRKLKAITSQSTTEFIRNFRLQRAAQLILQDTGTMAEIAYKVGFNSQAYFNKSFQELFECSPTEYKKNQK